MILNDEPNCQVSRILISHRPIYVKRSENDSHPLFCTFFLHRQSTENSSIRERI
jgi:hypothetical protein